MNDFSRAGRVLFLEGGNVTDRIPRAFRVTEACLTIIDQLLPATRDGLGGPSRHDFITYDFTPAVETMAMDFERMTLAIEGSSFRVMVLAGLMVDRFSIYARLADDDVVEVWAVMLRDPS